MNNSSVQESYSITSLNSSDTVTLTSSYIDCHTVTLNTSCIPTSSTITFTGSGTNYTYGAGATVGGISSIGTISSFDTSQFKIKLPEEWVDCFPDFNRIEKMCEQYPGLKLAYEKFVTTYKLVKEHYDTPEDQRPRP
jgi:hypothetical protein